MERKAASLYAERLEVEHKMSLADLIAAADERHGPFPGERRPALEHGDGDAASYSTRS
ncbi:hypothetical protein [Paraburkholderia sp. BR14374]|uniref:hypothetical protein n=1 Tax=Paraburkholderia sp. BR14374 TaxID=3237007 RepID=UPI0034CDA705